MFETSRKETMFDKSDNVKEEQKKSKPQETPEEKQQQEVDDISRKFLKNSNPDRAGDAFAFASIQSASDSYAELQNTPSWQDNTIDQATKDGITTKYKADRRSKWLRCQSARNSRKICQPTRKS